MSESTTKPDKSAWWRGNFPLWIVVILLGLIFTMVEREVDHNDDFHVKTQVVIDATISTISDLRTRVALLEQTAKTTGEALARIEQKLDDAISRKNP